MINFKNDYSDGMHPKILDLIVKTNNELLTGYGTDKYTSLAKELIKKEINDENADVYFLVGGTQTNVVGLSLIPSYGAILTCDTGHIATHEAGAIERTSAHPLIHIKSIDGKMDFYDLEVKVKMHKEDQHMSYPKAIYISNTTEYGTIYTLKDLKKLREIADKYNLYLFLDGARLGSALTAKSNDLTLELINQYTDLFYIGGTKNGLPIGEALIISNPNLKEGVLQTIKQRGALLAKGRFLGLTFYGLFKDKLFYEIGQKANDLANELKVGLQKLGFKLYANNDTNQTFVYVKNKDLEYLSSKILFESFVILKEETIIRLVTSYVTTKEDVENAINTFNNIK